MERISNDISKGFSTRIGRNYLVENYCNSGNTYFGINEDGEDIAYSTKGFVMRLSNTRNDDKKWVS